MDLSGCTSKGLADRPGRASSACVLCLCADAKLDSQLRDRLANCCELIFAGSEGEASSLLGDNAVAVVILEPGPTITLTDELRRALFDAGPSVTLLVLADPRECDARSLADVCRVRFVPDPTVPGILEQAIEDYLERYRFGRLEQTLTSELDKVQQHVDLLAPREEHDPQDTASLLRLYHVVSGLSGLTTPQEVGELLVSTAAGLMKSRRVALLVPDADRQHLRISAAVGVPIQLIDELRVPVGRPISGSVFAAGRSVLGRKQNLAGWNERSDRELIVGVPFISMVLTGPDYPLGVLTVSDPITPAAYSEESLTGLHAITEAAAIALANQIRGQERNDARDSIMMALAKLAESRDPETGAHLERVQNYCRVLAETLVETGKYRDVITSEFISTLVWSSPLHDIGKVGVPDHILLKPGQLTDDEFEIMKRHPIIGGDTIRAIIERSRRQDFLEMAMQIAYYHHEKYDGSGYPYGLAGEGIPLPARIMALADVYDALTTARVYKSSMPHAEAAELIRRGSGIHFAPDVVDAFNLRETDFAKFARDLADSTGGNTPKVAEVSAIQIMGPCGDQFPVRASLLPDREGPVS